MADTLSELAPVRAAIAARIAEFLAEQRQLLAPVSGDVVTLLDSLDRFMAGGKRLRALFLVCGWRAAGGADLPGVVTAAAALEFLQAGALIHDDVMDRSDVRRGHPAVHRSHADGHAESGWAGSSQEFGDAAAILLGDLCLCWADQLFAAAELPAAALTRGRPVFDVMRTELMAGQYLDVLAQARRNDSVDVALHVATFKSAKYTIERPLHLGAALGGADPELVAGLRRYGLSLGRAFQLRDDLLGVFGDPAVTGKPSGDDLREGKRTALIALALAALAEPERTELAQGLDDTPDAGQVARMTDLVAGTPARAQVEHLIAADAADAAAALAELPVSAPVRAILAGLITAATDRVA